MGNVNVNIMMQLYLILHSFISLFSMQFRKKSVMNQGKLYRPLSTKDPTAGDSWENLLSSYLQKRSQDQSKPGELRPQDVSRPSVPKGTNPNQNQNQGQKLQTIPEENAHEGEAAAVSQNLNNSAGSYCSAAEQLFEGPEVFLVQPFPEHDYNPVRHDSGDANYVNPISDTCRYALLDRLYERVYGKPQMLVTPPKRSSAEADEFLWGRKRFRLKQRVNRADDGFSSVELFPPSHPP